MPQPRLLGLYMQKWSWEGRSAMLNLKVANKAVIKSTWKEQACQKERQRHKSLSLFNGLCPFIGGRQPWRLLASVPFAQRAGLFILPVMKHGSRTAPTRCTENAGSGPGPAMGRRPRSRSLSSPVCQRHVEVAAALGAAALGAPALLLARSHPQPGGTAAGRATPLLCDVPGGEMTSPGEASQLVFSSDSLLLGGTRPM